MMSCACFTIKVRESASTSNYIGYIASTSRNLLVTSTRSQSRTDCGARTRSIVYLEPGS